MELQTTAAIQKMHAAFVDSINEFAATLLGEGPVDPKALLEQKRQFLQSMQDQLDEVTSARAAFEKAYDREIGARERAIATLEDELAADAKDLQRLTRVAARAGAAAKAGAAARRGGGRKKGRK